MRLPAEESRARLEPFLLLAGAAALALPLLSGRILSGHDTRTYLMYAQQTAANLREGVLLPAWAPELNGGYGGPGLFLYPPLVHFLHGVASFCPFPLAILLGIVSLAGTFVSGLALRGWIRAEGRPEAALAASLVYMAAPYRMVDLYERSALSEHWAFVFPPLILWVTGFETLADSRRAGWIALASAGLLLTNLPLAALFGLLLLVWLLSESGELRRKLVVATGGALGCGLALFALVPAALSGRWVATEPFYGASAVGFRPSENTLFSSAAFLPDFNWRVSWSVLATVAIALLAWLLSPRARGRAFWLAAVVAGFVVTLSPFGPVWDHLPVLSKLQFPWRLAALLTLGAAALTSFLSRGWERVVVLGLAIVFSIPFVGRSTAPFDSSVLPVPDVSGVPTFPDRDAVLRAMGNSDAPWLHNPQLADVWYLPRTLGNQLAQEIFAEGPAACSALAKAPAAVLPCASISVKTERWTQSVRTISLELPASGSLALHSLFFPGLEVEVDGRTAPARLERNTGLLAVRLGAGKHRVSWGWSAFGPIRTARRVSLVFLAAILCLLALSRRQVQGAAH